MSDTNDREKALLIQFEIERLFKDTGLPFVIIIGIPDENGASRSSMGCRNPINRDFFMTHFIDYMEKFEKGEAP